MLIVMVLGAQGTTVDGALNTFAQHIHSALRAVGKTAVVWEGRCDLGFRGRPRLTNG